MNFECTEWGILIGDKYLSAREALDLLQWLSGQRDTLLRVSREVFQTPPEQEEWGPADEQEMKSEDEQIANIEL